MILIFYTAPKKGNDAFKNTVFSPVCENENETGMRKMNPRDPRNTGKLLDYNQIRNADQSV